MDAVLAPVRDFQTQMDLGLWKDSTPGANSEDGEGEAKGQLSDPGGSRCPANAEQLALLMWGCQTRCPSFP